MDKIKQYKHYCNVCMADMSALVTLADQAMKEKSRRTLFKVRCADIQELYDEFMKQHGNLIKVSLGDDDADVESEKVIRQTFLEELYVVKATYTELFENANADNYPIAYDTLVDRYSDARLRSQAHWSAIESVSKVNQDNSSSLRNLLDVYSKNLAALKVINYPVGQWDFISTMMMLKKLDDTVTRFKMEHRSIKMPNYEELKNFLNNECMVLDTLHSSPATNRNLRHSLQKTHLGAPRTKNLFVDKPPARSPAKSCIFCKADHALYYCPAFTAKSQSERHNFCKTRRLCFNCLSSAYDLKSRRSTYQCKICHSRYHHTFLCSKTQASGLGHAGAVRPTIPANVPAGSELNISETILDSDSTSLLVNTGVVPRKQSTLLSTAWIDICNNRGQYQPFRCLLDSGSMISFITQKVVSKLGLRKSAISIEAQANEGLVQLSLKPLRQNSPLMFTEAVILEKITAYGFLTSFPHFFHSGVDFGGPFLGTLSRHRGVRTSKAYLCLFVCFTTKAVHLELASDLSALQRFIARRGRVSHLYCDNATNFVEASRELKLMRTAAEQEMITFKFSPPSGPHFNGLAEAGVKLVKLHLAKVVGEQIMTYEKFYTVLTLIESILNSRPSTPFSSDVEDINALRPLTSLLWNQ
ncbi:hypothetical protein JTB14_028556 [Gonioctena quinquepunctata]|nr:hypothetical protein JTB14_028556 [Gonioctena quinquepunctata]